VGNEAVDQLAKFNRALVDHSEEGTVRTIDGILLTKFDTIDDKVGYLSHLHPHTQSPHPQSPDTQSPHTQSPHTLNSYIHTLLHPLQVGAAISMTYTTGQPIVFVGMGQRFTDLRTLNVSAVVTLLLK